MLRSVPAVQFVFAKFETLRRNKESGEPLTSEFLGEASDATRSVVEQHAAVLQPSSDHTITVPETNDQSEREKLIRRRWTECASDERQEAAQGRSRPERNAIAHQR
jgi:transcriptional regulator of NAD metabolism